MKQLFSQFNANTPGYAVIAGKEKKITFEECVGLDNLEKRTPITSKTAFRLASLTKPFTAMAIMILKEKGLLKFDDELEKFFPDFPTYGRQITIRQLLTHTSGMPDHEKPLYKKLKKGEEPTIYDSLEVIKEQKEPLFNPGGRYLYSDMGFVILALIIEKVSGQKYSKFLKKYIFEPLDITNTIVFDETKPNIKNRAYGYRKTKNGWMIYDYDPLNYIVGDEGIYSTVCDLAKWRNAWTSKLLVSNETLKEALTPYQLKSGELGRCGFSWFVNLKKNLVFQPGSWVGFNNIMLIDYNSQTTVIMLSNTTQFPTEKEKLEAAKKILRYIF